MTIGEGPVHPPPVAPTSLVASARAMLRCSSLGCGSLSPSSSGDGRGFDGIDGIWVWFNYWHQCLVWRAGVWTWLDFLRGTHRGAHHTWFAAISCQREARHTAASVLRSNALDPSVWFQPKKPYRLSSRTMCSPSVTASGPSSVSAMSRFRMVGKVRTSTPSDVAWSLNA